MGAWHDARRLQVDEPAAGGRFEALADPGHFSQHTFTTRGPPLHPPLAIWSSRQEAALGSLPSYELLIGGRPQA